MTIEEIRIKKQELEEKIIKLLETFQEETGIVIQRVTIERNKTSVIYE